MYQADPIDPISGSDPGSDDEIEFHKAILLLVMEHLIRVLKLWTRNYGDKPT